MHLLLFLSKMLKFLSFLPFLRYELELNGEFIPFVFDEDSDNIFGRYDDNYKIDQLGNVDGKYKP